MKKLFKVLFLIAAFAVLTACSFSFSQDEHETGYADAQNYTNSLKVDDISFLK